MFSVNQATQLYVAKAIVDAPAKEGDIYAYITDDNKMIYFSYYGKGGRMRSDLIPINSMEIKTSTDTRIPLPAYKISLISTDTDIVAGQDYFVRIKYSKGSIDNQYLKYGVVHTYSGMTVADFYTALYNSLKTNLGRNSDLGLTVSLSVEDGVTISVNSPSWTLGINSFSLPQVEVSLDPIEEDGMEKTWGVVEEVVGMSVTNSQKIADLEWFCMGERGDQYKNTGWPNIIPTSYMVDPNAEGGYCTLNIHYAYTGSNEAVQKSEKDIVIVSEAENIITYLLNGIKYLIEGKNFDGTAKS